MTFVTNNGKVPYIMVAGNDHVSSEMPLADAQRIYDNGIKRASNRFEGYPICVDNLYFFAGKPTVKTGTSKKKAKSTES